MEDGHTLCKAKKVNICWQYKSCSAILRQHRLFWVDVNELMLIENMTVKQSYLDEFSSRTCSPLFHRTWTVHVCYGTWSPLLGQWEKGWQLLGNPHCFVGEPKVGTKGRVRPRSIGPRDRRDLMCTYMTKKRCARDIISGPWILQRS